METKKPRSVTPPSDPDAGHVRVRMSPSDFVRALRSAELDGYESVPAWIAFLIAERELRHALRSPRH